MTVWRFPVFPFCRGGIATTALLYLLLLIPSGGLAANPYLVKDVNADPIIGGRSLCGQPVSVGDMAYFCGGSDSRLWRSDGTESGTRPLLDADGNSLYYPTSLVASNGLLYFTLRDVMWVTDGSPAGTQPLQQADGTDFAFGFDRMVPSDVGLYVFARSGLWMAQGSLVRRIASLPGMYLEQAAMVGGTLFFIDYEHRLWKSDGTEGGTVMVVDLPNRAYAGRIHFAAVSGTLYFTLEDGADSQDLWKSDGTAAGTVMVKKAPVGRFFNLEGLTAVGGLLHFVGDRVNYRDLEFWVSDGTEAGTRRIKVIPDSEGFEVAVAFNNRYVVATRDTLWVSDGTEAGTLALLRSSRYSVRNLAVYRDILLFAGDDGGGLGVELWRTDGTLHGTRLVWDIGWGAKSSDPHFLAAIDRGVLFQANKGDHLGGDALWLSDGTRVGTERVKDLEERTKDAYPRRLTRVGDTVYFLANMTDRPNLYQQWELWRTDGSEAGTAEVVNLIEERTVTYAAFGDEYGELIAFGGELYFVGRDDTGWHLWRTDGTASGTRAIGLAPGAEVLGIHTLTLYRDKLFFFTETPNGSALWKVASGASQARLVKDDLRRPDSLLVFSDALYFVNDANQIWRSTGRAADTVPVTSIARGFDTSVVDLVRVNDALFTFRVLWDQDYPENFYNRAALWVSDGSAAGTYEVTAPYPRDWELLIADGAIWFGAFAGLWIHDGGSRESTLLADQWVGHLTDIGDAVYFSTPAQAALWVSDGTREGTRVVADRVRVSGAIAGIDGEVYFSAYDTVDGTLWSAVRSDSLALRRLRSEGFGADVIKPGIRLGDTLGDVPVRYFFASSEVGGSQIWVTDGSSDGTRAVTNFSRLWVLPDRIQLDDTLFMSLRADSSGVELWGFDLEPGVAAIGDYVWWDQDGDGIQDEAEPGLPDVSVWLEDCEGSLLQKVRSDGLGRFWFDGLSAGNYRLRFITPAGYALSPRKAGDDVRLDSNPDTETGLSQCRQLSPDQWRPAIDAGFVRTPD